VFFNKFLDATGRARPKGILHLILMAESLAATARKRTHNICLHGQGLFSASAFQSFSRCDNPPEGPVDDHSRFAC
jgi:hypothetical protein